MFRFWKGAETGKRFYEGSCLTITVVAWEEKGNTSVSALYSRLASLRGWRSDAYQCTFVFFFLARFAFWVTHCVAGNNAWHYVWGRVVGKFEEISCVEALRCTTNIPTHHNLSWLTSMPLISWIAIRMATAWSESSVLHVICHTKSSTKNLFNFSYLSVCEYVLSLTVWNTVGTARTSALNLKSTLQLAHTTCCGFLKVTQIISTGYTLRPAIRLNYT
jgi:hypothetical protein